MSIAIIIATHGVAAEQLLKTTEMLIGEQEDVAYIDFVPGENAETIMGKYQALVEGPLSHCDQVLFWWICGEEAHSTPQTDSKMENRVWMLLRV